MTQQRSGGERWRVAWDGVAGPWRAETSGNDGARKCDDADR